MSLKIPGEVAEDEDPAKKKPRPKLNLDVKIDSPSACERHITVTIPRDDIDRYYDKAFSDLMGTAVGAGLSRRPRAAQAGREPLPQGCRRPGQGLAADGQHGAR